MKQRHMLALAFFAAAALAVRAGELSPDVEAKFLKVIATSSGGSKIACSDPTLKSALEAQGLVVDNGGLILWATNANEARMGKTMGRLVVTSKRDLSANAAIILEEDGGRPKLLLNPSNLRGAKVQPGDAILHMAGKI